MCWHFTIILVISCRLTLATYGSCSSNTLFYYEIWPVAPPDFHCQLFLELVFNTWGGEAIIFQIPYVYTTCNLEHLSMTQVSNPEENGCHVMSISCFSPLFRLANHPRTPLIHLVTPPGRFQAEKAQTIKYTFTHQLTTVRKRNAPRKDWTPNWTQEVAGSRETGRGRGRAN